MNRFQSLEKHLWEQAKPTIHKGKKISAAFYEDDIVVYQAFNDVIADHAVQNQTFEGCDAYSMSRMSWIKPNFLWMMYRSDWADRDKNQKRILALYINKRDFEEYALKQGVLSYNPLLKEVTDLNKSYYKSSNEWNAEQNNGSKVNRIRVQWDPYHLPNGHKLEFSRAIQIGLKGSCLLDFMQHLTKIEDITPFVQEQNALRKLGEDVSFPVETVFVPEDPLVISKLYIDTD